MTHTPLNRRDVLSGLVASAATLSAAPGFALSKMTVGAANVLALSDGSLTVPISFFSNVTEAQKAAVGETIQFAANTYAYQSGDRTFLFDTGSGLDHFITQQFPDIGKLPGELSASGIDAAAVTDIVITHMHVDHIGGLVAKNAAVFPNATIHIAEADWAFWTKPGQVDAVPDSAKPMVAAAQNIGAIVGDNVKTHVGEVDLGAGVALIPTPGHTPGHSAVMLTSGSEQLMLVGDAIVSEKIHFENPEAGWALEFDKSLAAQTRRTLLDWAATDKIKIAGSHLTAPGTGYVERNGTNYRFVAA